MYRYNIYDNLIIKQRINQYNNQLKLYLSHNLNDDIFRILRLQNGFYKQKNSYMLRVSIPYGLLSSNQMRILSFISRKYDCKYGHLTTRQNIQFNWIKLEDTSKILCDLSILSLYSIQTSGNCIRNITSDEYSGVSNDEIIDSRIFSEIIRQWSILNPEFSFLPRKFKISLSSSVKERVCIEIHDVGLFIIKNLKNEIGFRVFIGGGLGRTPILAKIIENFIPWRYILLYLESILRIYNIYGFRENIYKARIKILAKSIGYINLKKKIYKEFKIIINKNKYSILTFKEFNRIKKFFNKLKIKYYKYIKKNINNINYNNWVLNNTTEHRNSNFKILNISIKNHDLPTGNLTNNHMKNLAFISDYYSDSNIFITRKQNLVFNYIKIINLYNIWCLLKLNKFISINNSFNDIICCPGGDFCSLANAKSINISYLLNSIYNNLNDINNINNINISISGCINSCSHHHISNIGLLGINKNNKEFYQILIGGNNGKNSILGKILGAGIPLNKIPIKIYKIIKIFKKNCINNENFIDTFYRLSIKYFKY